MEPFQERVIYEKGNLDGYIARLNKFLLSPAYQALPAEERGRLTRQFSVMEEYSKILGERIVAFGGKACTP